MDTSERNELIVLLYSKGETLRTIGDNVGLSHSRVHRILKRDPLYEKARAERIKLPNTIENSRRKFSSAIEKYQWRMFVRKRLSNKHTNNKTWEWDVEFEDLEWPKHCPVFGLELYYSKGKSDNSAEFDRINSSLGYTKNNTRIISRRANRIKNDGTATEHLLIAEWMQRQQTVS